MARKTKGKYKELDNNGRFAAMAMLIGMGKFKPIEYRDLQFVAEKLKASTRAVARLWKSSTTRRLDGILDKDDVKNMRENCGGPTKYDPEEIQKALKEIPRNKRKI